MNWTTILIVAVILTAFLMFSKGGQIPATDAAACLKTGALALFGQKMVGSLQIWQHFNRLLWMS